MLNVVSTSEISWISFIVGYYKVNYRSLGADASQVLKRTSRVGIVLEYEE